MTRILAFAAMTFLATGSMALAADEPADAKKAPEKFTVRFDTTAGTFDLEVTRKLAPKGADHFHDLVTSGFYNDCGFFRVVPNFVVQFGINGDPEVQKPRREKPIKDDPVVGSNLRGFVTFATAGKDTRTTQLFINLKDNQRLDGMGFSPFGQVTKGMDVVDKIFAGYGEQPQQNLIQSMGNDYLKKYFPKMDFVKTAVVLEAE